MFPYIVIGAKTMMGVVCDYFAVRGHIYTIFLE
jgi:hypothetical protein